MNPHRLLCLNLFLFDYFIRGGLLNNEMPPKTKTNRNSTAIVMGMLNRRVIKPIQKYEAAILCGLSLSFSLARIKRLNKTMRTPNITEALIVPPMVISKVLKKFTTNELSFKSNSNILASFKAGISQSSKYILIKKDGEVNVIR